MQQASAAAAAGLLADHTIILTRSYRSTKEILDLAACVNRGDPESAVHAIFGKDEDAAAMLDERPGIGPVEEWLGRHYSKARLAPMNALRGVDPGALDNPDHPDHKEVLAGLSQAFEILDDSRILTLSHLGARGRLAINALAEKLLHPGSGTKFFHGEQVILGENLHGLDLYNGDTGIILETKNRGLQVVFRRGKRYVSHALDRLSGIEPAFAMTVHKSQGSEFDAVLLVLPEAASPLLTRQIIYTGLTRAKLKVRILGSRAILEQAIATRDERPGGIELGPEAGSLRHEV